VQVAVAVDAWHGLLEGRFRLLDRWCAFMRNHYKPLVVTEDTWTQVRSPELRAEQD
jgi:DCN1-like protein 1/2